MPATRVLGSDSSGTPARAIAPNGSGLVQSTGGFMNERSSILNADQAAELLTVLGNSKRLAILANLLEEELSVGTIAQRVELSQSALSQHLARLRALGLVETRRDRQMIYYSCRSDAVRRLLAELDRIYKAA